MKRLTILLLLAMVGVGWGQPASSGAVIYMSQQLRDGRFPPTNDNWISIQDKLNARIDSLEKRVAELERNQIKFPEYHPNPLDTTRWYQIPGTGDYILRFNFNLDGYLKSLEVDTIKPERRKP